jgi:hypothetical protein
MFIDNIKLKPYLKLVTEFEFKIFFLNSSGNRPVNLGNRGNRIYRAPSLKKTRSVTKSLYGIFGNGASFFKVPSYFVGLLNFSQLLKKKSWACLAYMTILLFEYFL